MTCVVRRLVAWVLVAVAFAPSAGAAAPAVSLPREVPDLLTLLFGDGFLGSTANGRFARPIDPEVRRALERSRGEARANLLAHLKADVGPELRAKAIRVLCVVSEPEDADRFAAALDDSSSGVQRAAVAALVELGSVSYAPRVLEQAAEASDESVRKAAHEGLVAMGEAVRPYLEAVASSAGETEAPFLWKRSAMRALGHLGEPGVAALRRSFPQGLPAFRAACAAYGWELLPAARRIDAVYTLNRLLDAARAQEWGPNGAVPALLVLAAAPAADSETPHLDAQRLHGMTAGILDNVCHPHFRSVAELMGAFRVAGAVPALLRALEPAECVDSGVVADTATALGQIGDARALPPLRDIVNDVRRDSSVRGAAANALTKMGDPEGVRLAERYRSAPHSAGPSLLLLVLATLNLILAPLLVQRAEEGGGSRAATWILSILSVVCGGLLVVPDFQVAGHGGWLILYVTLLTIPAGAGLLTVTGRWAPDSTFGRRIERTSVAAIYTIGGIVFGWLVVVAQGLWGAYRDVLR